MEVVDSPLNLAHQQCRKADRLLAAGKYEEAISCHGKAADLLRDAMKLTECEQARLSMELQRDSHVKQQRLIQERWKRETRREATKTRQGSTASARPPLATDAAAVGSQLPHQGTPSQLQACPGRVAGTATPAGAREREYDTLIYQLQLRHGGGPPSVPPASPGHPRTAKDDKTRLEEQETTIEGLRQLVIKLMEENQQMASENQRLAADNQRVRSENARLRSEAAAALEAPDFVECSELWATTTMTTGKGGKKEIAIPQLPPLEMPAQEDLCLDDLPPLEDIQNELQEMLDRDNKLL